MGHSQFDPATQIRPAWNAGKTSSRAAARLRSLAQSWDKSCPKGGRITLGLGGSASGAFLYAALGISAEGGISIPTDFFSTGSPRGTQFYGSTSFQGLAGFGFFAGAGGSPSAGYPPVQFSPG